jgi:hypothetical protein
MICSSVNLDRFIRPSFHGADSSYFWLSFRGSGQEADEAATLTDMRAASEEGLQATWIQNTYDLASCRWSDTDARIALCRSRYHRGDGRWLPSIMRYRRDAEGRWRLAP